MNGASVTVTFDTGDSQPPPGRWQRPGPEPRPLMRDGLYGSVTSDAGWNVTLIGSNKVYAAIHQFGGVITAKRGPDLIFRTVNGFAQVGSVIILAGPYRGISAEHLDHVLDVIEAF